MNQWLLKSLDGLFESMQQLSLEDALTAFEQGVRLTRDAQQRLDSAELKVRALSEAPEGKLDVANALNGNLYYLTNAKVVQALKKIHVPVVRWPGGCFADLYNWRDGIGPRAKRPTRINVHWGGVTDNNAFGTHEFMNFAELIGADPYVSINLGSLTPYDAAQWVEYMTSDENASLANERRRNGRPKAWQLKYVGIGNETWGCGGNMDDETAAQANARYSTFVNAQREMGMIKVASGATGNDGGGMDHRGFGPDGIAPRPFDQRSSGIIHRQSVQFEAGSGKNSGFGGRNRASHGLGGAAALHQLNHCCLMFRWRGGCP